MDRTGPPEAITVAEQALHASGPKPGTSLRYYILRLLISLLPMCAEKSRYQTDLADVAVQRGWHPAAVRALEEAGDEMLSRSGDAAAVVYERALYHVPAEDSEGRDRITNNLIDAKSGMR